MEPRGRKPKGNYKQMTKVLSTRIRADTRSALEQAAKDRGHSLSQEIEHRLRRSFDEDEKMLERFGSRQNYAILRLISCVMEAVADPKRPEATWLSDQVLFGQLLSAVVNILQGLGPGVAPVKVQRGKTAGGTPWVTESFRGELSGKLQAAIYVDSVRYASDELPLPDTSNDDPAPPSNEEVERRRVAPLVRSDLGAYAERYSSIGAHLVVKPSDTRKPKTPKGRSTNK